ncbi:methyltransferase, FxLD system [Streptomyces ipomoeae]|uniref:methyltransferase, FxLD system n=1 Tax=Streptomyces ipomoeae TaxID=103232 RepID=UPI0029ACFBE7|nr:methyltransferase, FxLD system [Streptomyces ipomoeae]MDX2820609.1 methyltransferase, FxLD system [Streptomyces ipomoeae]MDX2873088.1 methyltransferase, FxLD system [Streptomyces ipomoeae]
MTDVTVDPDEATRLRNKVVDQLKEDGTIVSPAVEAAMRKVPRHLAVPEASLSDAYSTYNAVITQEDEDGNHTSSVSAPQIQAMQLEQAGIRPGDNVLEIGTNGPNAAYLAELVGPTGQVTTVDIDPAPADRARRFLAETGYTNVNVVVADAEDGVAESAPYDAIVVTLGAWDIPPAWIDQLKDDGRLVVPLRINGLTRTYGFIRRADHLVATSAHVCGFVAVQGAGSHTQQVMQLPGEEGVTLRFDEGLPANPSLLDGVLNSARAEAWTGVTVASQEPIGTLQMYLSTQVETFCFMSTSPESATGKIGPTGNSWSMVAIDGPHFAYTVVRRDTEKKTAEYGVHAFGPDAAEFAERIADIFRTWGEKLRGTDGPRIAVYPAGTPDDLITGDRVVDKRHSRISISWPTV